MTYLICITICAICMAIKGGWHGGLRRYLTSKLTGVEFIREPDGSYEMVSPNKSAKIIYGSLDGKILSTFLFGLLILFLNTEYQGMINGGPVYEFVKPYLAPLAAIAWLIGVSPSMGEEAGSVGGYKGAWGEYVDYPEFGRMYGVKKALQRGVFTTAALAIVLNAPLLLIFGALMPLAYYAGISIHQYRSGTNRAGWALAEPIYGAIIGIGIGMVFA